MNGANQKIDIPQDLKLAILYKKGSCSFYKKVLTIVKQSECAQIIQEMIKDETEQIKRLEDIHCSIDGKAFNAKRLINYDPKKHGGIALPQKNDIDTLIALRIAIKDKRNSIEMYEGLIKKYEDSGKLLQDLLVSDREYLLKWEQLYKNIKESEDWEKTIGDAVYRFTEKDVAIVTQSLENERSAYRFFILASEEVKLIDVILAFRHISSEEKRHIKILEMIYHKLTGGNIHSDSDQTLVPETSEKFSNTFDALDMAIEEDKRSISMYFKFVDECTNTWLRDILWEIIDDEWSHLLMWRRTYKRLKEEQQ